MGPYIIQKVHIYTAEQGYSAARVKAKSSCGKGVITLVVYLSTKGLSPEDLYHRVVKVFFTSPTEWLNFI